MSFPTELRKEFKKVTAATRQIVSQLDSLNIQ